MELQHEMRKLLDSLRTERDNLRVKIHLGSMEAKEEFEEAEKKWQKLKAKASALSDNIAESSHEMTDTAKVIAEELGETYSRIADRLKKE